MGYTNETHVLIILSLFSICLSVTWHIKKIVKRPHQKETKKGSIVCGFHLYLFFFFLLEDMNLTITIITLARDFHTFNFTLRPLSRSDGISKINDPEKK